MQYVIYLTHWTSVSLQNFYHQNATLSVSVHMIISYLKLLEWIFTCIITKSKGTSLFMTHEALASLKWLTNLKWKSLSHVWLFATTWTVHRILQARILESVAVLLFRGSSQSRDQTRVSCSAGGFFTSSATREAQEHWSGQPICFPGDLPDPRIELGSPALQADSLPRYQGSSYYKIH